MSQKLLNKVLFQLKQGLLIMLALKYGEISHMIQGLIYGHLDVFFMK